MPLHALHRRRWRSFVLFSLLIGLLLPMLWAGTGTAARAGTLQQNETPLETMLACANKVVLMIGRTTPFAGRDKAVADRLTARGMTVVQRAHDVANVADAEGKDLIVISESVYSNVLGGIYRDTAVPIVTWEAWLYPLMGMTASIEAQDFGETENQQQINIVDSSHELAAGLTGIVTTHRRRSLFHWGVPNNHAIKIATMANGSDQYAIFAYESGAQMVDQVAPARRVGLQLADDYMSQNGSQLFDAAVDWAMACTTPVTQFTVSTEVEGSGSVFRIPNQTIFSVGATVVLVATPDAGWTFDRWEGDRASTYNPLVITVDQNLTIRAIFRSNEADPTPTNTPVTPVATDTPTHTVTATPTHTPSYTPTSTPSSTVVVEPTATTAATATDQPDPTATPTATATLTPLPSSTVVPTSTSTATNTPSPSPTQDDSPPQLVAQMSDRLQEDADQDGLFSPGDTIRYTVDIENSGGRLARDVEFTVSTDPNSTLIEESISTSQGTARSTANPDGSSQILVSIKQLAGNGERATIEYDVRIKNPLESATVHIDSQGTVSSANSVGAVTDDPDKAGDADPTVTPIMARPRLRMTKTDLLLVDSDANNQVSSGDTLIYVLQLFNNGNAPALNIRLEDTPDANTTLISGLVQAGAARVVSGNAAADSRVVIELDLLSGGGSAATVSFAVVVNDSIKNITLRNQAAASFRDVVGGSGSSLVVISDDPDTEAEIDATLTRVNLTLAQPYQLYLPLIKR